MEKSNNISDRIGDDFLAYLTDEKSRLYAEWISCIKAGAGSRKSQKIRTVQNQNKNGTDLLTVLLKIAGEQFEVSNKDLEPILLRIGSDENSIEDFFIEVSSLDKAIEKIFQPAEGDGQSNFKSEIDLLREKLSGFFKIALCERSLIYEHVMDSADRGFCLVDKSGNIIFANKRMKQFCGDDNVIGRGIESFFLPRDHSTIHRALEHKSKKGPFHNQMSFIPEKGEPAKVEIEIGPVLAEEKNKGSYVCLTDIELQMSIFNKMILGVMELNTENEIIYANQTILDISGSENLEGKHIKELFPDKKNWDIIKKNIARRKKGLSDEYDVCITRLDDKKSVPVKVWASPKNDMHGNRTGTMALVRDRSLPVLTDAIHSMMSSVINTHELLDSLGKLLLEYIPFEYFSVTVYTKDMKHCRRAHSYSISGEIKMQKRWWEINPVMKKFIEAVKQDILIADIHDFMTHPDWQFIKNDADFKNFVESGFRSFIFFPVRSEGQIIASITFFSRKTAAFKEKHRLLLKDLPLERALFFTRLHEKREELDFMLNLIKELSSAENDVQKVGEVFVDKLSEHFEWRNVSLFRVDEERRLFHLIHQGETEKGFELPEGHTQDINVGILNFVYSTKKGVNIGDVKEDRKYRKIFIDTIKATRSELCLPIIIDGRVCWLLNIEDPRVNAFADEELSSLEELVSSLSDFMNRCWLYHQYHETFESSYDAIIMTNMEGDITQVNTAGRRLLGYAEEDLLGKSFTSFLKNNEVAEVFNRSKTASDEVILESKTGDEINVLLSGNSLPSPFGGKVFVAKDLAVHKRMEELEYLDSVYHEIAVQTKTPLSLVFAWLNRVMSKTSDTEVLDVIRKSIQQLRKVSLTYDRMALYGQREGLLPYNKILLNVSEVIDKMLSELPDAEKDEIEVKYEESIPPVQGDLFQLNFCLESIISYLLRNIVEHDTEVRKKNISIEVRRKGKWVQIIIGGGLSETYISKDLSPSLAQVLVEISLGRDIIKKFINNHDGRYYEHLEKGREVDFRIELPVKRG